MQKLHIGGNANTRPLPPISPARFLKTTYSTPSVQGEVANQKHQTNSEESKCTSPGQKCVSTPADKDKQPNRKARNGAEAQTQTNTQQLPPVKEGTLEVPSQQNSKQPAQRIANVQTEISTLDTEGANHRQGVYAQKHSVNELAI